MPDIALTNRIVKIHLSSWRYFALLTLPPLVMAFNLLYSFASLVLLMLFLVTHYYCWRLWLDERLFTLLNKESSLAEFDEGMAQLWIAKSGTTRTLTERWRGVRGGVLSGYVLTYCAVADLIEFRALSDVNVG